MCNVHRKGHPPVNKQTLDIVSASKKTVLVLMWCSYFAMSSHTSTHWRHVGKHSAFMQDLSHYAVKNLSQLFHAFAGSNFRIDMHIIRRKVLWKLVAQKCWEKKAIQMTMQKSTNPQKQNRSRTEKTGLPSRQPACSHTHRWLSHREQQVGKLKHTHKKNWHHCQFHL